jgi:hypothetical protein
MCEHPCAALSDSEEPETWYCPDCGDTFLLEESPEEDDVWTEDCIHWYQYGKLVVTTADPRNPDTPADDCYQQVLAWMDQEQFWPNAWYVQARGDSHLLNLSEGY